MNEEHYFDWAATSPADSEILKEALETSLLHWANPSSVHALGKDARTFLESSRENIAKVLKVPAEKLFFTSGGTESNHIPLLSVLSKPNKSHVLFSSVEHPAIREMALELKKCGIEVESIPADKNGIIQPEAVVKKLKPETSLVCVMAVNNETGAIQPVEQIANAIKEASKGKRKPKFHVDCVQALGKIPLDISKEGIDSASFSAHKICGPRGIGLLHMTNPLDPFLRGGGQEKGYRSGTENTFGAYAFSKCIEKYAITENNKTAKERFIKQKERTQSFITALSSISECSIIPKTRLENPELFSPWVVQASFKNIPGQVMLRALDAEGFYISTGSACSARKNNRPVLEAMNISKEESENAVRFSFGPLTTEKAMQELLEKTKQIAKKFNG